ncbi:uncharacterized protein [Cherax quadricarinatus]|uniref:uncharacterized protein n=1 Tax=Cherax quadricarinatus TaxID=27406 RepID=UPI00387E9845
MILASPMWSTWLLVLVLTARALALPDTAPQGFYTYGERPPAVIPDPNLRKVYELFYPYYQRPRYRYPFYNDEGKGELLYGYGGPRLFKYTVFKPVEGFLRR